MEWEPEGVQERKYKLTQKRDKKRPKEIRDVTTQTLPSAVKAAVEVLVHLSPWSTLLSPKHCRCNLEAVLRVLKASGMRSILLQRRPRTRGGERGGKEKPFKWILLLCNSNLREGHYRGQRVSHIIHSSSSRTCRMALWSLIIQVNQMLVIL